MQHNGTDLFLRGTMPSMVEADAVGYLQKVTTNKGDSVFSTLEEIVSKVSHHEGLLHKLSVSCRFYVPTFFKNEPLPILNKL